MRDYMFTEMTNELGVMINEARTTITVTTKLMRSMREDRRAPLVSILTDANDERASCEKQRTIIHAWRALYTALTVSDSTIAKAALQRVRLNGQPTRGK